MRKINIAIRNPEKNKDYIDFLKKNFYVTINNDSNDVDLVIFTGGADVNPKIYNEKKGDFTFIDESLDKKDYNFYEKYKYVPKLGICRGAQFLTVMSKGSLIQHVEGHNESHLITTNNGKTLTMSSSHHQMMNPYVLNKRNYKLLAWSTYFRSHLYLNGENESINFEEIEFLEPEIVFYKNTNSLCIQGHPEWEDLTSTEAINYCLNLIEKQLKNEL